MSGGDVDDVGVDVVAAAAVVVAVVGGGVCDWATCHSSCCLLPLQPQPSKPPEVRTRIP